MMNTTTQPSHRACSIVALVTLCGAGGVTATARADIRADLNRDGIIDAADLALLLARWGSQEGHFGDLDLDGSVTAADVAQMLAVWGNTVTTTVYTPTFELDYSQCSTSTPPTVGSGAAGFGTASSPHHAGRVVSANGYRNITRIEAEVDLSGVTDNFVNAAWYMVNKSSQPIGGTYCDSGGSSPWCNEIDFLETNANALLQSTIHLDSNSACGYSCDQRFEFSYTDEADTSCFGWSALQSASQSATSGTHSLVGVIDVSLPFTMTADFDLVDPRMTVTVSQTIDGVTNEATVYDSDVTISPSNGSATLDMSLLPATMETGWWLVGSMWQGYSPGQYNDYWTNTCSWGSLCGGASYWSLSNVQVTAESEVSP